jgi:hypothetical protein
MVRKTLPALILMACASAAWGDDDALLPTHLIDGGQVFATGTLRYIGGKGDAEIFGVSGDFKQSLFQLQIEAGIGLGSGFEIDAAINYQFIGKIKSEFSAASTEFDTEEKGFSDLVLNPRFAILRDSKVSPQLVIGAIVVAPVGNDKDGQTGITVGGIETQQQEDGGIGGGVWRYGLEAGISKNLAVVEPYLVVNYVISDDRKKNGVEEEPGDVLSVTLGARWHLSDMAGLDTRLNFVRTSKAKEESGGAQSEEEGHLDTTAQVSLYLKVGSSATLTIVGGVSLIEDHELNDLIQMEMKDNLNWFAGIGLHILIGGGDKKK